MQLPTGLLPLHLLLCVDGASATLPTGEAGMDARGRCSAVAQRGRGHIKRALFPCEGVCETLFFFRLCSLPLLLNDTYPLFPPTSTGRSRQDG